MNLDSILKAIDKASDMMWRVVATALGVFILIGICVAFVMGGIQIYKYKTHQVNGVSVKPSDHNENKTGLNVTVQYGMPLALDGSDYLIIPVMLEKKEKGQQQTDFNSEVIDRRESLAGYTPVNVNRYEEPYYNLVIKNKKTGDSRLLLDHKAFIQGIYFPDRKPAAKEIESKFSFILFKIAIADTNHDQVINIKDAVGGYVSDVDGTKLTRITPEDAQMGEWRFDLDSQTLFVEVIHDFNKDKKFDLDDPKTIVAVDVRSPKMGQELVSQDIKNKVNEIFKN